MIDAASARVLHDLDTEKAILLNAYTPGFTPDDGRISRSSDKVRPSLNPLAAVAPPDAYFVAQDTHGRTYFTRAGDFRLLNGRLCTGDGNPVLGFDPSGNGDTQPIVLDPVDVALHRVNDPQIDARGRVSYVRKVVDAASGTVKRERVIVGTLALARFPAGTSLSAPDGIHATAPGDVRPTLGVAHQNGFGQIVPGWRDEGRVSVHASLEVVRDTYVQYDALRSASLARSNEDKTAMDLIK